MTALDGPPVNALLRRAQLVAKAEEQAAIATEQAALAHEATADDLLSLPVAALALEQTALLYAGAYARWAQLAVIDRDPLLGRSLEEVARTLRTLADQAQAAAAEAAGYAESVRQDAEETASPDSPPG